MSCFYHLHMPTWKQFLYFLKSWHPDDILNLNFHKFISSGSTASNSSLLRCDNLQTFRISSTFENHAPRQSSAVILTVSDTFIRFIESQSLKFQFSTTANTLLLQSEAIPWLSQLNFLNSVYINVLFFRLIKKNRSFYESLCRFVTRVHTKWTPLRCWNVIKNVAV